LVAALLLCLVARAGPPPKYSGAGTQLATEKVSFKSGDLTLYGYLYKPEGAGPFPVLVWNHGSEKNPNSGPQFDTVASIFVPAGYVVFAPMRRGHGDSEGQYIVDRSRDESGAAGWDRAAWLTARLLDTEQVADQVAGVEYVKRLPFVDTKRIAVAGCSYGGIETLFGAEQDRDYKVAISISPGALSWEHNSYLQRMLVDSVERIDIPVLLIQPPHDASLAPSRVLGATAARAGKPLTTKIYPAAGPRQEQEHCFGGARGMHVWAEDAKAFLAANLH
jgi:dienelactone hydrolase